MAAVGVEKRGEGRGVGLGWGGGGSNSPLSCPKLEVPLVSSMCTHAV